MRGLILAVGLAVALGSSASAQTEDFSFYYIPGRFTDAIIYGMIFGLENNTASTPTALTIYAVPCSCSSPSYQALPYFYSITDFTTFTGTLDVVNDQVVGGSISSINGLDSFSLNVGTGDASYDVTVNGQSGIFVYNPQTVFPAGGTAPVFASAAPEPSIWALMFAGIGALGLGLRRRSQSPMSA